jgi:hypothetical protein
MSDVKTPAAPAVDPLAEIRDRLADIATVVATLPAPFDPVARLAHTRLSLFADAHAEAERQAAELRAQEESRQRQERTSRQLASEGRAAATAR